MTWTTYKASDIGFNATFGGYEGHFTMTPAWTLAGDHGIRINADNGYVTQIEYMGRVYQHQNASGANIHGGNHTTANWLTFDIGQFRSSDGVPLNSLPGWQGAWTITLSGGGSVPCFVTGTMITMMGGDEKPVQDIEVGDMVATLTGSKRVLWVGSAEVEVTEKTRPCALYGLEVSPQHRILIPGKGLIAAKYHPAAFEVAWPGLTVPYHHFLLEEHSIVWADDVLCESLWPGKETLRMLGDAFTHLIDVEAYCAKPAAPFLNRHGEVKQKGRAGA